MKRREFFTFLGGVAVLAATNPLHLLTSAEAAPVPGSTPATAMEPIVEIPPAATMGAVQTIAPYGRPIEYDEATDEPQIIWEITNEL